MKLSQSVRFGAWFLIALNLFMAFGCIWVFARMAPAIETIIKQNERSLFACEGMLSYLALADQAENVAGELQADFLQSLQWARDNISEKGERVAIATITKNYQQAFTGNNIARQDTVSAIRTLSQINRSAMILSSQKARQFGHAGAWGIVFMASAVFLVGMLFLKGLKRGVLHPLEEIYSVIQAFKTGDHMRRCTGVGVPQGIRFVFRGLNDILDQHVSATLANKAALDARRDIVKPAAAEPPAASNNQQP